jgi:hypothetical protein
MQLDWDRPGVVTMTLKVPELAALVAGARLAAAALASQSAEQAAELERVLTRPSAPLKGKPVALAAACLPWKASVAASARKPREAR